ncbi:hypothetical protein CRENBAI_019629 [Crenichthys baileyi]|uniref:Uncharacterized protein n=1 Tax=Crenichthys baileyi TaxID=28760 RepID=A0AAV9RIL5_9TELE
MRHAVVPLSWVYLHRHLCPSRRCYLHKRALNLLKSVSAGRTLVIPSILESALVPAAAKHPRNMMLPPPYFSGDGVPKASPLFPPNATLLITSNHLGFSFITPQDIKSPITLAFSTQKQCWEF